MPQILAITQVTLDGVMQGPGAPDEDRDNGFAQGGWAMPLVDDVFGAEVSALIGGEFSLLLGRRTYDIWAGYWPYHTDDPIGAAFDRATKYVVSTSLQQPRWARTEVLSADVVAHLQRLKADDGPTLHVWGSGQLLQTLIAANLIDEYRIWTFPVVVGGGKRLFEAGVPPTRLTLVETKTTPTGITLSTYRPAGALDVSQVTGLQDR